jgi:hypothetical protein
MDMGTNRSEGTRPGPGDGLNIKPRAAPRSVEDILEYAVTMDGYAYAAQVLGGDLERLFAARLADYQGTGRWTGSYAELRCWLFAEQRRVHFDAYHPSGADAMELFHLYEAVCRSWTALHPDDPVAFTPPLPLDPASAPRYLFVGDIDKLYAPQNLRMPIYPPPSTTPKALTVQPALESWMAHGHPDQERLELALASMEADVRDMLPADGDLSIGLDVSLSVAQASTHGGHDLDNYLLPIARRIGNQRRRVVSARATKRAGTTSYLAVDLIGEPLELDEGWEMRSVRTTVSSAGLAWKEAVAAAVADAAMIPGEAGIELQLSFVVASGRNWTILWKPAIDSLGAIFGADNPAKPFNPRDDRIVSLGLHRFVDDSIGNDVHLSISWRS